MSEITPDLVRHLGVLARIDLSDEEVALFTREVGAIAETVATVSRVATADVPATSHPIPLENVVRPDVVGETLGTEQALRNAPDADAGRFRVGPILGEEQ